MKRLLLVPFAAGLLPAFVLMLSIHTSQADSATWRSRPFSGDWNGAENWTPGGPPNGPTDTATFKFSHTTNVSVSFNTEVNGIVFNPGASAFTIAASTGFQLTISGLGITNSSGIAQNFVTLGGNLSATPGKIEFANSATAGSMTVFTNKGSTVNRVDGGITQFSGSSSAGTATFINKGGAHHGPHSVALGGRTDFFDNSTAANGTFINEPGMRIGSFNAGPGFTSFSGNSTAANGTFTNNGGATVFSGNSTAENGTFNNNGGSTQFGGSIQFGGASTAGNGIFTNNNGFVEFANTATAGNGTFINNGGINFFDNSTAANGTFINNGGAVSGAGGGFVEFFDATAGNATLIANGGLGGGAGGLIEFSFHSTGGTARIEVFDNGALDISCGDLGFVTLGSIEGNGNIFLGALNLTAGSNNLSTTFSGVIQDGGICGGTGGVLTKIGSGKLVLSNANTYTRGTVICCGAGKLVINNETGSGTGSGPVQADNGTLGGRGTIAGAVTVGTGSGSGAILSPGKNENTRGTLTIQSTLTFNSDASYKFQLNSNTAKTDSVVANGVTINSGALFSFTDTGSGTLTPGTVFTVIDNTSANPIAGTFSNLPDNSTFTSNGNTYQASYTGGTGNDLTLTVQ